MDSKNPPTSTVLGEDDEYDLISNPGQDLDSTSELPSKPLGKDIPEPPPAQAARDKLETSGWSAEELQAHFRKILNLSPETYACRTVRIYVDGPFDCFNVGHALQLRQIKLAFPYVHLSVGVFPNELLQQYGYSTVWPELERVEMVRHCRWVDEVLTEIPWVVSDAFLLQRRIDYVAVEEGASIDPNYDKARVKGYDEVKRIGKVLTTRRIRGITTYRLPATGPSTPVSTSLPRLASSPAPTPGPALHPTQPRQATDDEDDTPEPKLDDIFGIAS